MWADSEENNVFNGLMLIGMCTCECHGCDDVIVQISTNSRTTKWVIMQDRNRKVKKIFSFNAKEYKAKIEGLYERYYCYSWETYSNRIRHLCSDYIRTFSTKDGYPIEGLKINKIWDDDLETVICELDNEIEIYYYSNWEPMGEGMGRPNKSWIINFDGKTLESAMEALKKFTIQNLVKNDHYIPKRKEPFKLLYTKDKDKMEEILAVKNHTQEKQLTWDNIENQMRESINNSPGANEEEKLNYFKEKILNHLDNLQEEEN